MIDIRTLLFANAVVFAVLAVAMLLVWRGNPTFPGLSTLARVHAAMIPGFILIGLSPDLFPALLSVVFGNALVVLGVMWLLQGIRRLYGFAEDRWPRLALLLWGAGLLFFLYVQPSLRGRILTTSCAEIAFVLTAAWTAWRGLRKPEDRRPSLLIFGSLGLLAAVFAARCLHTAFADQVTASMGPYALTVALVTASLVAATGWSFGVMNLVYARLNGELARDMTERKRYEAALEQLVQVAAHELRNPLTSIFGTLQLLSARRDALSEEDKDRLLTIAQRNSARMVRLVDDLLDLERIESRQATLQIETVDLEKLLRQAKELSEVQAARRGVALELAPGPPARVRADAQRLQQVVTNLLSNAIKFSPSGETVRLSAGRTGTMVRVELQDRGPGIPQNLQPRIFQRFARGEAPGGPDDQAKGSGLGLAISKALIDGMGGRIGFETSPTAGTTFYFELPGLGD
jgi:signal transduction histidine kinase